MQRRADFARLKAEAGGADRWRAVVDTRYASLCDGLIVSPWIDGAPVQTWDERRLRQIFDAGRELIGAGLFEWDFCPGNVLDENGQIRLFDFGYMYRFDPLRHFNSAGDGASEPLFHLAERIETRNVSAQWLQLEQEQGMAAALAHYRLVKSLAHDCYCRLRHDLARRNATPDVLGWIDGLIARWADALARDPLPHYFVENWRSHVLDLDDDLHGQSCTPLTLARADWLLRALAEHHPQLVAGDAFFWTDRSRSQAELRSAYQVKRARALELQLPDPTSGRY